MLAGVTLAALPVLAAAMSRAPLGVAQGALPVLIGVAWYAWVVRDARRHSRRAPPGPGRARRAFALVGFFVAAALAYEAVRGWTRAHVAEAFRVPGGAMAPAVLPGDWLYAVPLGPAAVDRDQPVVYRAGGLTLLHRVAGLPGDTVAVLDGRLVRDGRPVPEPYVDLNPPAGAGPPAGPLAWRGPLVVPDGHVFVLGDRRWASEDSRAFGPVPLDSVVKRPTRVYFSRDPATGAVRWGRAGRAVAVPPRGAAQRGVAVDEYAGLGSAAAKPDIGSH
jgi:signal peptidase I